MTIQPDARGKVYRRTTNGVEDFITVREALDTVNDLMMNRWDLSRTNKVKSLSSSRGRHVIEFEGGGRVVLTEVDAADMLAEEEPATWSVASHRMLHHRFTEASGNGRAVCNKSFRPWRYGNGYSFRTLAEVEASEHRYLYTICPRCTKKSG
jgi:hypothetical protein